MFKAIGLLFISFTFVSGGFLYCHNLNFRKKYLEDIIHFIGYASENMRYRNVNKFEIFNNYSNEKLLFLKNIKITNIKSNMEIKKILAKNRIFDKDIDILSNFIKDLGNGDLESQINQCKYYKSIFENLLNDSKNEIIEKSHLVKSLSILCGLAIFIIFI